MNNQTELNEIEKVTLAFALLTFIDNLNDTTKRLPSEDVDAKVVAPLVAHSCIYNIVEKLDLKEHIKMFSE